MEGLGRSANGRTFLEPRRARAPTGGNATNSLVLWRPTTTMSPSGRITSAAERIQFPANPADESLTTWAHRAAHLGEREAARPFLTQWATGEPRTEITLNTLNTLNTLRFYLAELGYLTEAVEVQKEAIALAAPPTWPGGRASTVLTLVRLQRRAGDFPGALRALRETHHALSPDKDGFGQGVWRYFVKEFFLLVPATQDRDAACRLMAAGEEYLRGVPRLWMDGVLDAAVAAAEHVNDHEALHRCRALQQAAAHEREQEINRTRRPPDPTS